ncbi:hypothetical protein ACIA5G_33575 [Amycolatopsis sp. NPDC051758]
MVSDRLHGYVVGEGAPGLDPADFASTDIVVKTFQARAWLWTAR